MIDDCEVLIVDCSIAAVVAARVSVGSAQPRSACSRRVNEALDLIDLLERYLAGAVSMDTCGLVE